MIELIVLAMLSRPTPIMIDWDLMARAQTRAEYLCEHKQWSHDNFEKAFTGREGFIAENLVKNAKTPKQAHIALINSPTHNLNIQNPIYKHMGVGKSCGIYVQLFSS